MVQRHPRPARAAPAATASRHPHEPIGPDDLAPLFPMALIMQEVSTDSYIDIPGEVLDIYRLWRPTPLLRASAASRKPSTHRPGSSSSTRAAAPLDPTSRTRPYPRPSTTPRRASQRLTTETGAGQWGSALAFATAQYGIECEVWQVRASYDQKPYRKTMMEIWGCDGPSQSRPDLTEAGRAVLGSRPRQPRKPRNRHLGGCRAGRSSERTPATPWASVLNHVLLHQTIIGEEALLQLAKVDETPDLLVGCTGRRIQLRRPLVPLPEGEVGRTDEPDHPLRRTGVLPVTYTRRIPVRLRRHGPTHTACQDAHPRPHVRPGSDPRRWPALPRHVPARSATSTSWV